MALRRAFQLGALVVLAMSGSRCDSPTAPAPALTIANLSAVQAGLQHQVCGGLFEYAAVDELKFDVVGPGRQQVLGMTVLLSPVSVDPYVATIVECPVAPACTETKACLISTNGNTNSIHVRTVVPWTTTQTWTITVVDGIRRSNELAAAIHRPDGLPSGTHAAFVYMIGSRLNATAANFELEAYSPGIAGRRITFTMTATSNGTVVTNSSNVQEEVPGQHKAGLFGGFRIAPGPTQITATLVERDAAGTVIAEDTRTIIIQ